MFMLMTTGVFLGACVLLFLLKRVLGLFWSSILFFVANAVYLMYGFEPLVPQSVLVLFLGTLAIAQLLYVSSSEAGRQEFFGPIMSVLGDKKMWPLTLVVVLAIPSLVAWQSHNATLPSMTPPPPAPPPPSSVTYQGLGEEKGYTLDVIKEGNPFRAWESDPEKWDALMEEGKTVYYQNCYYCHGDKMEADGHYAEALRPTPANFLDPGNLPMLTESFVFWRVAKGGPGMPDAGTPWDSSMPVWEKFLTWQEAWAVIVYMYDYTGYQPRAQEDLEAH